ncbi:hypothetical protein MTO96_003895 [Rhipicephalus appendiculatus]
MMPRVLDVLCVVSVLGRARSRAARNLTVPVPPLLRPDVLSQASKSLSLRQSCTMGVFAQISAIIWKDVWVQLIKRHYFIALGEILLVVLSFTGVENDRPILPPGKCAKLPCLRLSEAHRVRGTQPDSIPCASTYSLHA